MSECETDSDGVSPHFAENGLVLGIYIASVVKMRVKCEIISAHLLKGRK